MAEYSSNWGVGKWHGEGEQGMVRRLSMHRVPNQSDMVEMGTIIVWLN